MHTLDRRKNELQMLQKCHLFFQTAKTNILLLTPNELLLNLKDFFFGNSGENTSPTGRDTLTREIDHLEREWKDYINLMQVCQIEITLIYCKVIRYLDFFEPILYFLPD